MAQIIKQQPVGFQGYAQDQYIDNKVTRPIGTAIYENRTPMQVQYDNQIQRQALGDVSDMFIPGAPLISKGVRSINAARKVIPKKSGLGLTDDMIKNINDEMMMAKQADQEIIKIPKSVVSNNEQRMWKNAEEQMRLESKVQKEGWTNDNYIEDMLIRKEFEKLNPKDSGQHYPYTDKDIQNWWNDPKSYSNNSNLTYTNNPAAGDGMPSYDQVVREYYKTNSMP